jgi:hypothetical protein
VRVAARQDGRQRGQGAARTKCRAVAAAGTATPRPASE